MTDPHITCLRTEADRQATTYGRYTAVLSENERLKRELAAKDAQIAALREDRDTAFERGMREAGKRIFGDRGEP